MYIRQKIPMFFYFFDEETSTLIRKIQYLGKESQVKAYGFSLDTLVKASNVFNEAMKYPNLLFDSISQSEESFTKVSAPSLIGLLNIIKNRADEFFMFDHLTNSARRKSRGLQPWSSG